MSHEEPGSGYVCCHGSQLELDVLVSVERLVESLPVCGVLDDVFKALLGCPCTEENTVEELFYIVLRPIVGI